MKAYSITIGVIIILLVSVFLGGKYGTSEYDYEKQEFEAAKEMQEQQASNEYKANHPEEFDPEFNLDHSQILDEATSSDAYDY